MKIFSTQNLKVCRKLHGLTLKEMANKLNTLNPNRSYTHQMVSSYELGKHPLPLDTIVDCCGLFNVSIDDFVCRDLSLVNDPNNSQATHLQQNKNAEQASEDVTQYIAMAKTKEPKYIPIAHHRGYASNPALTRAKLSSINIPDTIEPYIGVEINGREMSPQIMHGDTVICERANIDDLRPRTTCIIITETSVILRNVTIQGDMAVLTTYNERDYPKYTMPTSQIKEIWIVTKKITATW